MPHCVIVSYCQYSDLCQVYVYGPIFIKCHLIGRTANRRKPNPMTFATKQSFWLELAHHFTKKPKVVFGFNEPYDMASSLHTPFEDFF